MLGASRHHDRDVGWVSAPLRMPTIIIRVVFALVDKTNSKVCYVKLSTTAMANRLFKNFQAVVFSQKPNKAIKLFRFFIFLFSVEYLPEGPSLSQVLSESTGVGVIVRLVAPMPLEQIMGLTILDFLLLYVSY